MTYKNKLSSLVQQMGLKAAMLLLGLVIFTSCKGNTDNKQKEEKKEDASEMPADLSDENNQPEVVNKSEEQVQKELSEAFKNPLKIASADKNNKLKFLKKGNKVDINTAELEKFIKHPDFYKSATIKSFIAQVEGNKLIKDLLNTAKGHTKSKRGFGAMDRNKGTKPWDNGDIVAFIKLLVDIQGVYKENEELAASDFEDLFNEATELFYPTPNEDSTRVYKFTYYVSEGSNVKPEVANVATDDSVKLAFQDLYARFVKAFGMTPLQDLLK